MTEATATPASVGHSAGAMLRTARERQGLHIAALAASIKVSPRKLEALEADRFDELPDLAFARALAQAVCRAVKIDPEPVLALLPRPQGGDRLEQVASGLKTPFREREGHDEGRELSFVGRPIFWAPAIVLLAAAVLYLLPQRLFGPSEPGPADAPAVSTPLTPQAAPGAAPQADATPSLAPSASTPVVDTVHSAPPPDTAGPDAAGAALLVVRATDEAWVEVRDAGGNVLLSRTLQAGETVGLDGALPLRATLGNAAGTQLSFRGQPLDVAREARDNIARLELK